MASTTALTVLIVATKAPWPPVDGGRLVLWHTLRGLSGLGHRLILIAPVDPDRFDLDEVAARLQPLCRPRLVPARPRSAVGSIVSSLVRRYPPSIVRHLHPRLRREVARTLAEEPVDVVQVEHVQAMPHVLAARRRPVPILLRAHNVESTVWRFSATRRHLLLRSAFQLEARRLEAWERRAVLSATMTVAVSELDVGPLERMGGGHGGRVEQVPAPFPTALEPHPTPLPGEPSVAVLVAGAWLPARDGARHFIAQWWPEIRRRVPGAHLHMFGLSAADGAPAGVTLHPAPEDSAIAFPTGSIVAIPFRHSTGVPIKCLEAWSRGLPIVAGAETASALSAADGEHLLVADRAEDVARALERLLAEPQLRARLVAGGRQVLARRHDPALVAKQLVERYRRCLRQGAR